MNLTGSPEWFYEKSQTKQMKELNSIIENRRTAFIDRFSPERLNDMNGSDLLQSVFSDDPASMIRLLMFDKDYRLFGAAGQYKYLGIVYQESKTDWKYKESANPVHLLVDEAAEKAEWVRDQLIVCMNEIESIGLFTTINDYRELQSSVERVFFYKYPWVMKYYQMLYPHFFPGMYADGTISRALHILGLPDHGAGKRLLNAGEISLFIRRCDVNNILFNDIYGNEWGWDEDVPPCQYAKSNHEASSEPVSSVNLEYYETYSSKQKAVQGMSFKDIVSFPCGDTYSIARDTLIHAHPVKKGFPTRKSKYLMLRGNGGISDELFKVMEVLEFDPYDEEFISNITNTDYQRRISQYVSLRKIDFGFKHTPGVYRFYVLKTIYRFDPPYIIDNNTQGYRYLSLSQVGLSDADIQQIELVQLEEDLDNIEISETDRLALIKTRINQGMFREQLLKRYDKCCLCGVNATDLLTASHIKPWSESNNNERLDPDNGFLLCPNHDKLFDRGYISFDDEGQIIISKELNETNRIFLNIRYDMKISLTTGNRKYLKFHRNSVFVDAVDQ